MLKKSTFQRVFHKQGTFVSNLLLVSKKGVGNRRVINLKNLNMYIPNQHFKTEALHLLENLLKAKNYKCNTFGSLCTAVTGNIYNFNEKVSCMSLSAYVLD